MHNSKPSWAQSNRLQTYSMMNNKVSSAHFVTERNQCWIWTCGQETLAGSAISNKQDLSPSLIMKTDACMVSFDLAAINWDVDFTVQIVAVNSALHRSDVMILVCLVRTGVLQQGPRVYISSNDCVWICRNRRMWYEYMRFNSQTRDQPLRFM